ncbi:MAG: CHAT domain-containing protein [Verrucomicrobia bacterium]|nr:CHAT domain-containing protein [Verrucomicrobiota bacterium]
MDLKKLNFELGEFAFINALALVCNKLGRFHAAGRLYQRALRIREKALGPDHPSLVDSLTVAGFFYEKSKDYANAKPLYERALRISEKLHGPEHLLTARCLDHLGRLYQQLGTDAKAEPLYQRALQITEKSLGPEHFQTALLLGSLASTCAATGDFARAEQLYRRQLIVLETIRGPEHPETANHLIKLGLFYEWAMSDCARAELHYQRALKITERALGPEHPVTANNRHFLAALYQRMGADGKAVPLYQRALETSEKINGPRHPHTVVSLVHLAALHLRMGNGNRAEPLYQNLMKNARKEIPPKSPGLVWALTGAAGALNELATEYERIGDCDKAESVRLCELSILERQPGPAHAASTFSQERLAALYRNRGQPAKGEMLLRRALSLAEKEFGMEHLFTASKLNSLGLHHAAIGEHEKAEPFYRRALKISETAFGPESPHRAGAYTQFGWHLVGIGKKSEALGMAVQADRGDSATLINVLSFTSESQRLAFTERRNPYGLLAAVESALGVATAVLRNKGIVLDSLLEDCLVAEASQKPEHQALVEQLRSTKLRMTRFLLEEPEMLSLQSREAREAERAKSVEELERLEGSLAREVAALGHPRRALRVTVEQVRQALPKDAVLLELLRYWNHRVPHEPMSRYGAVVLAASGEPKWVCLGSAEAIEQNVKRYQEAVRGSAGVSPAPVSAAPNGPKATETTPLSALSPPAYVEASAGRLEEERVVEDRVRGDLQLSTLLQALHQQLWSPVEPLLPPETKTVILSPDGALNFLSFATLLTPDDQFLSQKYSIRYVASGRDLLREFQVSENTQVTVFANPDFGGPSGAGTVGDATRSADGARTASSPATSACPERTDLPETSGFGAGAAGGVARAPGTQLREVEIRDFAALHLPPLPGTARESALLAEQARRWQWPIQVFEGAEASESRLQAVSSPRILHLATHGFFLSDGGAHAPRVLGSAPSPNPSAEPVSGTFSVPVGEAPACSADRPTGAREARALPETRVEERRGVGGIRPFEPMELGGESTSFLRPRGVLKNPMHRSGLALAGAQATLEAWRRGETASIADGIVTAAEAGTLKLEGTELVVLSACETGAGEAKSGEGVLGLRRGFIQAGARNLLMTLWCVADEETAQLMTEFYERFHATGDAPQALADVQRDWLVKLRNSQSLEAAVRLAGPFVLTFQGPTVRKGNGDDSSQNQEAET